MMQIIETVELDVEQREQLRLLWNREYPVQLAYKYPVQFDVYINNLAGARHYLLLNEAGTIKGWAFTFDREGERWFGIVLDAGIQKQGMGRLLLNRLKADEQELNGWVADHDRDMKQNGKPYISPLKFYEKNGFVVLHDTRLEIEVLSAVKINWTK